MAGELDFLGPLKDVGRVLFDPGNMTGMFGEDPGAALQEKYQKNIDLLGAYRPRALQAREQAMGHTLGAFGPANEYLKRMYGEGFGLDLQALGQPGIADYLGQPVTPQAGPQAGPQQAMTSAPQESRGWISNKLLPPKNYPLPPEAASEGWISNKLNPPTHPPVASPPQHTDAQKSAALQNYLMRREAAG